MLGIIGVGGKRTGMGHEGWLVESPLLKALRTGETVRVGVCILDLASVQGDGMYDLKVPFGLSL